MTTATLSAPTPLRSDARTIGLVGLAHGTSHFHHLLLPPMFPVFISEFGLSYAQLGLLVTVFFIISGVGQALAGFVVDKIGARPVLYGAMGFFVLAGLAAASANGMPGLVLAAALSGIGNCPFHPADFTILNKRVSQPRLGHAFSVHGISGNLGWALAPVFLIGLSSAFGHWRWAYVGTAGVAATVLLLLWWQREAIDDRSPTLAQRSEAKAAVSNAGTDGPYAFLKLPSVWLCFSFFFWTTAALSAIQSFASPALAAMFSAKVEATAFVVTAYMLCGALGMVIGGFVASKVQRLEVTIAAAMAGSALMLVAAALLPVPLMVSMGLVALAGLGTGLAGPSRDMLIKRASPPGATGRVYGTVYSGLDVGFALAAPVFGWILDHMAPQWVLLGSAATLSLGILSAGFVGWSTRRHAERSLAAA
jgi:MFS transporter, FSR family, fosmidomycin resistance protein